MKNSSDSEEIISEEEVGENGLRDFQGTVCGLYMTALLLVLPLYMKEGYWLLGDAKYILFRNVSVLCLLLGGAAAAVLLLRGIFVRQNFKNIDSQELEKDYRKSRMKTRWKIRREYRRRVRWSWVDTLAAAYGAANVISYLWSAYRGTAWAGYEQWHMGLLSQLLFVGIYFMVSRCYNGSGFPIFCGQAALLAAAVLGILNRCGVDLLGLFGDMGPENWDYTHLLSTLGNINWLCGYVGVALPFAVTGYLRAKGLMPAVFCYLTSVAGMLLLIVQGSVSGLAVLVVCAVLLLLSCCFFEGFLDRSLLLGIGLAAALPVLAVVIELRQSWDTFPTDDMGRFILRWQGWGAALAVLLLFLGVSRRLSYVWKKRTAAFLAVLFIFAALWAGVAEIRGEAGITGEAGEYAGAGIAGEAGEYAGTGIAGEAGEYAGAGITEEAGTVGLGLPALWGSGRGGLWNLAWDAFTKGNLRQKLIGCGPDCYAEYVYNTLPVEEYLDIRGHWRESVFTNAHNEWLSQLVNTGILGLVCYAGLFAAALLRYGRRCRRDTAYLAGLLSVCLYAVNSFVSFQQVLSTPLLFLALGLCEYFARSNSSGERLLRRGPSGTTKA